VTSTILTGNFWKVYLNDTVDNASLNTETHYYTIIQNEGLG